MPTVSFHTLGCKLNYTETSTVAREFDVRGFSRVPFGEAADVSLINTCTVTEQAEQTCRNAIRRALRANPEAFVIVTGCYAQLRPEQIAGIDGVDAVLGATEKFKLFGLIESFAKREQTQIAVSCIDDVADFGPSYSAGDRTRAFLKVQDGCDYSCSFCTIPKARGRSRSHPVEATVDHARRLADQGVREIVLSGINIGLYGLEHGTDFLELVQAMDRVEGIDRFRISSIEPNLLSDALIDFVAGSERFQPHFHIPLQSGDDDVLAKMRRRYKRALYTSRIERIKRLMPHAGIGVDVIVGFPAETPERFENTFDYLADLPVSYFHVFTYSERPDTTAVDRLDRMGGTPVPKQERKTRSKRLRLLSEKKKHQFYVDHLGQTRPVLWEGSASNGRMTGYTDNYIRAETPFDATLAGTIEPVTLQELTERGTVAAGLLFSLV